MSLNKFTNITPTEIKSKGVVALANEPNKTAPYGVGGLNPTNLKLWFDKLGTFIAEKINIIQSTLKSDDAASFIKVVTTGLDSTAEQQEDFEYSLQDIIVAFTNGKLANYMTAYESASGQELKSLQTILNGIAASISGANTALTTYKNTLLGNTGASKIGLPASYDTNQSKKLSDLIDDIFNCNLAAKIMVNCVGLTSDTANTRTNKTLKAFIDDVCTYLNGKVNVSDIVDNLTSTATNKPVSAKQAKILKDSLDTMSTKVEASIKKIELNSTTGVLTITKTDNSTMTIDLPLEFLVKNGYYNSSTQKIMLVLENNNTIEIPVGDLIDEYTGDNTTISLYVDSSDNKMKFKISDTYKQKIDQNTSARHSHSNKSLLDAYAQSEEDLADAVSKKHSHSNKTILDNTTASFTTAKESLLNQHSSEIDELRGMVQSGGTIIYENGAPLPTFNIEDVVYAAFCYQAEKATQASSCTKGGEIDRRLKALGG